MSHDQTNQPPDLSRVEDRDELISRYRHLRSVGVQLNHKLVGRLSPDVLDEGGKKLGLIKKGTLVFDSENEMAVLMDYCIYNVYRNGRNAWEQYLRDSPPPPDSDEMRCLEAMQRAIYSIFMVEEAIEGLGVILRDFRSDQRLLVVDQGLGSTAKPNLVLASRLLFHDQFSMTGGAALPIGVLPKKERDAFVKVMGLTDSSGEGGEFDPAPIIHACLMRGASSRVGYEDSIRSADSPQAESQGPFRNSRCPCGSGKKYKQCCMKKRK